MLAPIRSWARRFLRIDQALKTTRRAELAARSASSSAVRMEALLQRHLTCAADLHLHPGANSRVILTSCLDGGRVEVLDLQINDLNELRDRIRQICYDANIKTIVDAPRFIQKELKGRAHSEGWDQWL